MARVFHFLAAASLLVFGSPNGTDGEPSEESFNEDLIFWAVKKNVFFLHKTYAYYTQPRRIVDSELDEKTLFQSSWNGEIWSLAADYYVKRLYYSDHTGDFIGVYDLKTKQHMKVFQGMAWGIDSLSVDWISGNVYWADSNFNWIMVANRNFTNYRNLFRIESAVPAKVAVHPIDRYLYWAEKRENHCRLLRSDLAGYYPEVLHKFPDVQTITELVIDFVNARLYWTERLRGAGGISRVRYISLRNREEYTVHEVYSANNSFFFGLTSYKNHLYVTDDHRKSVMLIHKTTKELLRTYKFSTHEIPRGIAVFSAHEHPISKEDKMHECTKSPCEHICLARFGINQFECECRTGFKMQVDGRSCRAEMINDNFAILPDGTHSKIYQMNLAYPVEPQELQVDSIKMPTSVAYDGTTKLVYWGDEKLRTISRIDLFGGKQETLVNDTQVYSIALDIESRNMYWVDSEKDAMFVSRLDGSHARTLHVDGLYRVWAMAIDASRGFLYWSDWGQVSTNGSQLGVIACSRLDGTERKIIARPGSTPHGLTLDRDRNTLFWTQIHENSIGWLNLNDKATGKYRLPPRKGRPFPTGIAFWQNDLYISDMANKHIARVSVRDVIKATDQTGNTDEVTPFGPKMFYQLSAIFVYDSSAQSSAQGSDICSGSSCPHLCLPVHKADEIVAKCVCQDHYKYIAGNNSCVLETSTEDDVAPTFGGTCPLDTKLYADECSDEAELDFSLPTATDNSGVEVTVKSGTNAKPPMRLKEGTYLFSYTAVDKSHNKAYCRFRVEVIVRSCYSIYLKTLPLGANTGQPSCDSKVGSVINVTCPGIPGVAYQYECQTDFNWNAIGRESCEPLATAGRATPAPSFSSEASTKTTSSAATSREGATTKGKASTAGSRVMSSTSGKSDKAGAESQKNTAGEKASSSTTGLVVGLVISLIVLIALAAAVVILYRKRQGKGFLRGTNWNRVEDRVHLTGASTESGIYVGDPHPTSPFDSQELPTLTSSHKQVL